MSKIQQKIRKKYMLQKYIDVFLYFSKKIIFGAVH